MRDTNTGSYLHIKLFLKKHFNEYIKANNSINQFGEN